MTHMRYTTRALNIRIGLELYKRIEALTKAGPFNVSITAVTLRALEIGIEALEKEVRK